MSCCTRYCTAEAQFNRKVAERDLRRYRRRSADATTRLLVTELRRWRLEGVSILDVGGGIGVIGMELADSGVGSATVVEASPAYFDVTRSEVESRYGSRPTQFVVGDFAAIASTLADADVVTLDRVVCCYPDAEDLLRTAAQRARRLVALTYPRNRWYVRATCCRRELPDVISVNPSLGAWAPATAVPRSAHACFFIHVVGLPPYTIEVGFPRFPVKTISWRISFSGSLFRDCSHFVMFRPPSLLASQIVPTAATYRRRAAEALTSELNMLRYLRMHRIC
jgi:hypothetical protein